MAGKSKKSIETEFERLLAPLETKLRAAQETVRVTSAQIAALEDARDAIIGSPDDEEGGE
jgi:hypothetical protein